MTRRDSLDDKTLSLPGKWSLALSNQIVKNNLIKGGWLDLLTGYNYSLQKSLVDEPKLTRLISLDFKLNKKNHHSKIELKEDFLNKKIDFPNNSFENVTINNGLEHLNFPEEIIKECFRILKPNGVLQIIVPTWFAKPVLEFFAFRLNDVQAKKEIEDHKMYYDEKTLWPILVRSGFSPSKITLKRIKFFFSLYAKAVKSSV